MRRKKKMRKRELAALREKVEPILSALDRTNQMLKAKFGVKGMNYIIDNGIIQNGWLLSKKEHIKEATSLLEKQSAPVYILGQFYSAIFAWDAIRSTVVGSLWRNGKKVDEVRSIDMNQLGASMNEWFDKVTKGLEEE